MKAKILTFKSPITNLENKMAIFNLDNKTKEEVNILVCFDGQIFKTNVDGFNRKDGIEIFKHLDKNIFKNFLIILVSSMKESKSKYKVRKKELDFEANLKNSFLSSAMKVINKYLENIRIKNIFGLGFSLSGVQILLSQKMFNHVVSISPSKNVEKLLNVKENASVFYGEKEYKFCSKSKVLKPLQIFEENNKSINLIKYLKMKHTFNSWNNHFEHIIKSSIIPFLYFQKLQIKGIGKFIHDGSNISFVNKDKHLKIHFNELRSMQKEINFVSKTKYKNDYQVLSNDTYLKKYYKGERKKSLTNRDIENLAKELKSLHSLPVSKEIPRFKYNNNFDKEEFVMSHGDLNEKNIIFNQNRCYLIDFEWAMLHSFYWDIGSVFCKFNFTDEQKNLFLKHYQEPSIKKTRINEMITILKKIEKNFFKENKNYFITGKQNE